MNKLRLFSQTFLAGIICVFFSCTESNEVRPEVPEEIEKTAVFVVNEGNFGSGNGSISIYIEEDSVIVNNAIENANGGNEIGATIQSLFIYDSIGYVLCNGADKIEFIHIENLSFLANPFTNISVPRYMAVVEGMGYITCWGPYDANYGLPDSYVAVLDLETKAIIDTLECGSGPEGILAINNKLYVANSFETSVSVIDLDDKSSAKISFDAAPQHLVPDAMGNIWISQSSGWQYPADKAGIQAINVASQQKGTFVPILNIKGSISIDSQQEHIYVLTAESYPKTGTTVQEYNTITKTLATNPIISGDNFYGLGYNLTTDKIYVSDNQAFAGNGKIMVYNTDGMLLDEQVTGVGPNGFALK